MENSKEIIEAQLCAYIDGELTPTEQVEIERHLAANPQHRALIDDLRQMRGLLQGLPRARVPVELNENLTGSLERSALLDPSEGEDSAVVGRINRWPQFAAVAAVLILAIGLAIVVYSVLPPKGNGNLVALNDKLSASQPLNELRRKDETFAEATEREKKFSKDNVAEKTMGVDADAMRGKSMNEAIALANGLDRNAVENARRRMNIGGERAAGLQNTYCMFVSADNTAAANEQVTAYFRSNGILYAVNDAESFDQRTLSAHAYGVKAKGEGEIELGRDAPVGGGFGARGGGAGGGGGQFGGAAAPGSVTGGLDKMRPNADKLEAGKGSFANATTAEEKSSQPAAGVGVGQPVDSNQITRSVAKVTPASKPATEPAKGADAKDVYASPNHPTPAPREEHKTKNNDVTALNASVNTDPALAKPAPTVKPEAMVFSPTPQGNAAEQVIVARMSYKQLEELKTKLSGQAGQRAEIAQSPLRELDAVLLKQQQHGQQLDKPLQEAGAISGIRPEHLSITPAPAPTNAGAGEPPLEKRADRATSIVAATGPATRALKDGASRMQSELSIQADAPDELLDVLIVVKGGIVDAAGTKDGDAKPVDPNAK